MGPIILTALSAATVPSTSTATTALPIESERSQTEFLQKVRRLQNYGGQGGYWYGGQGGGGGGGDGENWWLADYSIKIISCMAGEQSINYERGQVESSTVIFRLCPVRSCANNSSLGCEAGYGDYAVGINTFAGAFVESVRNNYQYYDLSQMNEYFRECRALEGGDYYSGGYTYIGPACSKDGKNIRLATFSDPYCMYETNSAQNLYGNGITLPYSDGGIIPETCMGCYSQNYENWEWEVSDMCRRTYEDASYRCEENMESHNWYYGRITQGCGYINSQISSISSGSSSFLFGHSNKSSGRGETAQTTILFVAAVCVSAGLVMFFVQKKGGGPNRKLSATDDKDVDSYGLEIIGPNEAVEMVQKSQKPVQELVQSATNHIKKSVHNTAKKIVAMTRSSSVAKDGATVDHNDDGEDREGGAYQTMDINLL